MAWLDKEERHRRDDADCDRGVWLLDLMSDAADCRIDVTAIWLLCPPLPIQQWIPPLSITPVGIASIHTESFLKQTRKCAMAQSEVFNNADIMVILATNLEHRDMIMIQITRTRAEATCV